MTTRTDPSEPERDQAERVFSRKRARPIPLPQEYERLALLHAIGKLLTYPEALDGAWPLLLAALNGVMGLRTAVMITSFRGAERLLAWRGVGVSPDELRVAEAHARQVLTFLNHGQRDLGAERGRPFITLPLVLGARGPFGVLQLEGSGALEERDVLLLSAVANELAATVDRQYAWREVGASVVGLQDSNRWLRKLQTLSSAALESTTLDEALLAVLHALCRLFGTEVAELALLRDDDGQRVYKRARLGLPDVAATATSKGLGTATRVAAAGCPILFDDPSVLEHIGIVPSSGDTCSVIGAPLRGSSKLNGVVWTATWKQPGFTRMELDVLDAVVEGLAPVIEHTRLLEEQRKLTQTLEAQNAELRATQRALQATRDDYGKLYDLAPVGYMTLTETSAIEKLNQMAARILGVEQEKAVGTKFSNRVVDTDRPLIVEHLRGCIADAQLHTIEVTLAGRSEDNAYVRLDSVALASPSLPASSVCLAALVDISESRRIERERERLKSRLQEGQRLESLGVLAGGIAHDFNNLLSVILGYATLGAGAPQDVKATRASFAEIESASLRAAELCKQMLSYAGGGSWNRRPVALNQLLDDTARLLRASIQPGAFFHMELAPDLPAIVGDASDLTQLIMNLVLNASESMESGNGTVFVRTMLMHATPERLAGLRIGSNLTQGDFVVLEVEDTGTGMSAATSERIFEPFFSTKFLGRGLGLAVVFGVLRRHGAGIEVESVEGRGTSFRAWFPVSTQPVPVSSPTAVAPHSRKLLHGRVLLADDDDAVREAANLMLRDLGLEVRQARDGTECIAIYAEEPDAFAAILLDLSMPGLSSQQIFEGLRAIRPGVRVVLLSGFSKEQATRVFSGVAPAAFVQKPLRREVLRAELKQLLSGKSHTGR